MTLNEALKQLKALGNEKVRAHNTKYGAGDNQFGVKHGDIRVLAKKIRSRPAGSRSRLLRSPLGRKPSHDKLVAAHHDALAGASDFTAPRRRAGGPRGA